MMGNDVGAEGDAIAVAVQDDGGAIAFFDHVAAEDGAVGVLNDHAVAQVVVDIVAVHAQIEGVDAA